MSTRPVTGIARRKPSNLQNRALTVSDEQLPVQLQKLSVAKPVRNDSAFYGTTILRSYLEALTIYTLYISYILITAVLLLIYCCL